MSNFNFTPQGWECPKCHRVYSPTTMMCIACPQYTESKTSTGTTGPIVPAVTTTPVGYGTSSASSLCRLFVADPESGTSPKCINCGKSQLDHMTITNI